MKSFDLIYQFVVFANYEEVTASAENMKFFLENFGDRFIPNVKRNHSRNHENKSIDSLFLTSSDKNWNISIYPEKIDIGLVNLDYENTSLMSKSDFLDECKDFFNKISVKFPRKFKRIGFKSEKIFTEIDTKNLYRKFSNPVSYFSDNNPLLWENRSTFKKKFESADNEIVNINYLTGWRKGELIVVGESRFIDGFVSSIDINTSSENQEIRFEIDTINSFCTEALSVNDRIQNEIIEIIERK